MKHSTVCSVVLVLFLSVASACGDDSGASIDAEPIVLWDAAPPPDAPIPDAMPMIDAQLFPLAEAVGIDQADIVGGPAFAAIGGFLDLQGQIDSGALLLALEWRDLDDPSGQSDDNMAVGFYQCNDPDLDTSNNFDVDNPDRWVADATSVDSNGDPVVLFDTASTTAGVLDASSSTGTITLAIPGAPLPIELNDPHLQGLLVPSGDDSVIDYLADQPDGIKGMLTGTLLASTLGATPDFTGGVCGTRHNLLDILALGCDAGFFTLPASALDIDRDGDGLEKLCDTCSDAACAEFVTPGDLDGGLDVGTADGIIDCCVDATATTPVVVTGADCWNNEGFNDGYKMELEIHGTRVLLLSEVDPG